MWRLHVTMAANNLGNNNSKGNHCNTGNLVIKVTIITRKSLVPSIILATEATMVMLVNKISLNARTRTLLCKMPDILMSTKLEFSR
jgi:hypothetical protein